MIKNHKDLDVCDTEKTNVENVGTGENRQNIKQEKNEKFNHKNMEVRKYLKKNIQELENDSMTTLMQTNNLQLKLEVKRRSAKW